MQPDREIELRHGREDRLESGVVERPAGDVGENLNPARAELLDRTLRLLHRTLDVGHRHGRDESRKARAMALAQPGHGVIADARQVQSDLSGGKVLDRRVRQRNDLAVIAELVHLAKPLIEVEELLHPAQPRPDIAQPRRNAVHLLEKFVGKDVAVDIDDRLIGHCGHPASTLGAIPGELRAATRGEEIKTWCDPDP